MKLEQISKLIEELKKKKKFSSLTTEEEELLKELTFLLKIYTKQPLIISESVGTSSNACPTCRRPY